jgi:hypothetical protein
VSLGSSRREQEQHHTRCRIDIVCGVQRECEAGGGTEIFHDFANLFKQPDGPEKDSMASKRYMDNFYLSWQRTMIPCVNRIHIDTQKRFATPEDAKKQFNQVIVLTDVSLI